MSMVHAHAHQLRTTLHTIRESKTICNILRKNLYVISYGSFENLFASLGNEEKKYADFFLRRCAVSMNLITLNEFI